MNPSSTPAAPVGAAVHFVNPSGICRAALVTEASQDTEGVRDLHVFHPRELGDRLNIRFSAVGELMSWHTFEPGALPGCRAGATVLNSAIDPR